QPEVVMVRPLGHPRRREGHSEPADIGLVDGRARHALNADQAHDINGLDGTGQKVGILSDSFATTEFVRNEETEPAAGVPGPLMEANDQQTGDLPESVDILSDLGEDDGGEDEGAAMGE